MEIAGLSWHWEPVSSVSKLEQLWTELECRSDCSFFLSWDWIGTWLSETPGLSPFLLSVHDGAAIVAFALFQPATLRRQFKNRTVLLLNRSGEPSTDLITIEYNGIMSDRRYAQRVETALFLFLSKAGIFGCDRQCWQEVHVGLATSAIAERAREAGLLSRESERMPSWFADLKTLRSSGKRYLDSLNSNTRYQIRRSIRIYEQMGSITVTAAQSGDEAVEFLDELKVLHQNSWNRRGLPGSFANVHFEDFHRTLVRRCVERGTAEILRISAGKRVIGHVYNFIRNGRVYAYQTGLSYETDPRLKPGLTCHCVCIERHLDNGASAYDFMGGSARYKANLGIRGPDLAYHVIERKTLGSRSLALARRLKSSLTG